MGQPTLLEDVFRLGQYCISRLNDAVIASCGARKDNGSSGLLLYLIPWSYRVRSRVCRAGLLGDASCTFSNNGRKRSILWIARKHYPLQDGGGDARTFTTECKTYRCTCNAETTVVRRRITSAPIPHFTSLHHLQRQDPRPYI